MPKPELEIRPFRPGDEEAVIDLWRLCGLLRPWNDPLKDIQRKLKVNPELFLVGVESSFADGKPTPDQPSNREGGGESPGCEQAPYGTPYAYDTLYDRRIVATVMAGYEGHRGWINYLAVHPDCQRKGYGRMMMNRAEALLLELGCPKINLQVRVGNEGVIEFYRKLGYQIDQVVSLGKRLIHDD